MLSKKVIHMLKTDPNLIWEAIGPDGMTYNFDDSRFNKTEEQRAEIQERVNFRDNDQILNIGALIIMSDGSDSMASDACLGSIVRKQITDYLKRVEERENGNNT